MAQPDFLGAGWSCLGSSRLDQVRSLVGSAQLRFEAPTLAPKMGAACTESGFDDPCRHLAAARCAVHPLLGHRCLESSLQFVMDWRVCLGPDFVRWRQEVTAEMCSQAARPAVR